MNKPVKVILRAFDDEKLLHKTKDVPPFTLPINPENMTRTFKIERDNAQAPGNQHTTSKHGRTKNEELKFDFILDGTKTIDTYLLEYAEISVPKQIEAFLKVTYALNGEKRKPNFVKIIWGEEFLFDCVLTSLNITYTLFNADGLVLRAKMSVSFDMFVSAEKRVLEEDKTSEDMTKQINLLKEESFLNLFQGLETDPTIYLKVAKSNNMINFRDKLTISSIIIPPIRN